jgi:hypothetical protein
MGALMVIGIFLVIVGGLWQLVVTFQTSIPWGIFSLLFPVVGLIFVIMHWEVAKRPFLWQVAGVVIAVIGFVGHPDVQRELSL